MHQEATKLLEQLDADFSSNADMGFLSVAQQQMVEIAKALSTNAKIIILDEPTAALTANESEKLYRIVDKLKESGVSIIFNSHRFEDMYRLADRVTVFRDSQYIGTYLVDEISNAELIKHMVGREINDLFPKPEVKLGEEVLRVEKLSKTGYYKDVTLNVHAGEIVGLTGLVGAGRTEVMESVCGICDEEKEHSLAKKFLEEVDTKAVTIFDAASSLSGGNQQKVVVAKALAQDSMKVIIMDEPTKGVDVGAKAEILGMCDRIYVMCNGKVTGELSREEASQEAILEYAMEKDNRKEANK